MIFSKFPATSKTKRIILIAGIITIALAVVIITFVLIKRAMNKQRELLKVYSEADRIFWKGKKELDKAVSGALVNYWKLAGVNFTESQMQSASTHETYPWSAVYISSLVSRSGFQNFTPRTTHSGYTIDAKTNRSKKTTPSFWAYKPSEQKKVEIGDILVQNRNGGKYTLDTINRGAQTHGDIVVDTIHKDGKNYAVVQGGNVSNTVSTSQVLLTPEMTLPANTSKFAHLKYIK